eukprot:CAMPEP_0168197688 /NCGR_PEP_ID=MMETSP0139_2-20121125/21321_1 /TAXON_ID=44445 /ORGANISM="Pseudo-nitzschia australis, Strain 10249 10 AB" /LENGTH=441 /DNA_ID=CAMNT_0008122223 /DNA_START=50 /DNA_END=1375 /DNA_ORIENTATION=+
MNLSPSSVLTPPITPRSRRRGRPRVQNQIATEHEFPSVSLHDRTNVNLCQEENKENEDDLIICSSSSISLKIRHDVDHSVFLSEILPSFHQMPYPTSKNLNDNLNQSFETQETVSVSESEDDMSKISSTDDGDEGNSSNGQDSSSSVSSHSKRSIRFADELGLPIEKIRHYECDRKEEEHSELLILCMCPEQKKFEFLHVGYHQYEEENGVTIKALLRALPGMCTDPILSTHSEFVNLYQRSEVDDEAFENLCEDRDKQSSLTLTDCDFRENELIVASVSGSSEQAVLDGIGSLLSNAEIKKTLKRARRSRRSLQFVYSKEERRQRRRKRRASILRRRLLKKGSKGSDEKNRDAAESKERRASILRRRLLKKGSKGSDEKNCDVVESETEPVCSDPTDECCHNNCEDRSRDELSSESYKQQLLVALFTIGWGTVVFSAMGF